ncbi:kinase-like domain-containing protein [Glomus cerebriforme]|uniref:Kinase-like domain-containing protein n=1 Tax=Glomus cerebriforme TaxID=658196 RepID=A0A397S908_9GLOM|nr:kinase-like domain-containing protein [Glomus cerebriforme]
MSDLTTYMYGTCPDCNKKRMNVGWCTNCNVERLLSDNRWTSGDERIDNFIKHTQKNAKEAMDYLEWIDFDQFDLVRHTGKFGSFSTIYSAVWMEGPRWNYDEATGDWRSGGPTKVALKRLDDSQNLSQQFIKRLFKYFKCLQSGSLADFYGLTRDGTSCIMIVMKFYENGNLYSCLDRWSGYLCWRDTIDILWSISSGLQKIHDFELVHGNIHGGNILLEEDETTTDAKIADTGLIGPSSKPYKNKVFGVLPFIAPEILGGYKATKASDIYSFGIIMWMLSTSTRPHEDRAHDEALVYDICKGLRPNYNKQTPQVYLELMKKCLNGNPFARPTSCELNEAFAKWITAICDDPEPSDLSDQFDKAEEIKFLSLQSMINVQQLNKLNINNNAIYFSRDLTNLVMAKSRL